MFRAPRASDGPATGSVIRRGPSLRRVAARPGNSRATTSFRLLLELHQPQVRLEALALDEQPAAIATYQAREFSDQPRPTRVGIHQNDAIHRVRQQVVGTVYERDIDPRHASEG
jgi:hypothetical protein